MTRIPLQPIFEKYLGIIGDVSRQPSDGEVAKQPFLSEEDIKQWQIDEALAKLHNMGAKKRMEDQMREIRDKHFPDDKLPFEK